MKKVIFCCTAFFFFGFLSAQDNVGIGTLTPHPSAALEIQSPNKGLLIPRVELLSVSDINTVPNPVKGLLVFNDNDNISGGTGAGFYYWDGLVWKQALGPQGPQGAAGNNGANGVNGSNGQDGISVTSATVNSNGDLILTLSNSMTVNAGYVVGPAGPVGCNTVNSVLKSDGNTAVCSQIQDNGTNVSVNSLAGAGNRMVMADATGTLYTQTSAIGSHAIKDFQTAAGNPSISFNNTAVQQDLVTVTVNVTSLSDRIVVHTNGYAEQTTNNDACFIFLARNVTDNVNSESSKNGVNGDGTSYDSGGMNLSGTFVLAPASVGQKTISFRGGACTSRPNMFVTNSRITVMVIGN